MKDRRLAVVAFGVLCVGGLAWVQPAAPKPAVKAPPTTTAPAATPAATPTSGTREAVKRLAFLKGTWSGTMEGDPVEETWSAPSGDMMIGMFYWQHEGKTTMSEMLSVKAEGDDAVLRLRHFDSKFDPWKGECDGVAGLKATTVESSRVVFTNQTEVGGLASCEYDCTSADTLKVTVSFKDGKRPALNFELKKAK